MPSSNTILVSGATGKQGGAVIAALLRAHADAQIVALTRSKDSAGARKLAEHPNVRIVEGTFDHPSELFDRAGKVDQFFLMTTPSSFDEKGTKDEERQGKVGTNPAVSCVSTGADRVCCFVGAGGCCDCARRVADCLHFGQQAQVATLRRHVTPPG